MTSEKSDNSILNRIEFRKLVTAFKFLRHLLSLKIDFNIKTKSFHID